MNHAIDARRWVRPLLYVVAVAALLFLFQTGRKALDSQASPASLEEFRTVDWKLLKQLNLTTGQKSEALAQSEGRTVKMAGFMVPLEDEVQQATEFLLVPYFGACIHSPPPPPNQIVYVTMTKDQRVKIDLQEPIWVVGQLEIGATKSPYGKVSYRLLASRVDPY
jgi:uncharacterized protein